MKTPNVQSSDTYEVILKNTLLYFFILLSISCIFISYYHYTVHSPYIFGDWLINYQGGPVRRGFLGELVIQISKITNINPGIFVLCVHVICFLTYFFYSFLLLKKQVSLIPYLLLVISPFLFTFQINDSSGGFRKEILFFAILAFNVWASNNFSAKKFRIAFICSLLVYPTFILTHEMLAVFLPLLIIVYFRENTFNLNALLFISCLVIPSVLAFCFSLYYSGTNISPQTIQDIKLSLELNNYPMPAGEGAIDWLNKTASQGYKAVLENGIIYRNYLINYFQIILLSTIAFIPILYKLTFLTKNKITLLLAISSLSGTALMFLYVFDWGRLIYINLVAFFLLSFLSNEQPVRQFQFLNWFSSFKFTGIILLIFCYAFLWHIPHAGNSFPYPKSFKEINYISLTYKMTKKLFNE